MMLGHDIAAELPLLRAEAESHMTSTCVATTLGEPTWDDATGTYAPGEPTTVYSGKCRLRMPYSYPQNADAGEGAWAVDRGTLSLPLSDPTSAAVTDGVTVEM
ncbi:MAG: DUF6093 family protein, partial [Dermatophilaceae bacterium]